MTYQIHTKSIKVILTLSCLMPAIYLQSAATKQGPLATKHLPALGEVSDKSGRKGELRYWGKDVEDALGKIDLARIAAETKAAQIIPDDVFTPYMKAVPSLPSTASQTDRVHALGKKATAFKGVVDTARPRMTIPADAPDEAVAQRLLDEHAGLGQLIADSYRAVDPYASFLPADMDRAATLLPAQIQALGQRLQKPADARTESDDAPTRVDDTPLAQFLGRCRATLQKYVPVLPEGTQIDALDPVLGIDQLGTAAVDARRAIEERNVQLTQIRTAFQKHAPILPEGTQIDALDPVAGIDQLGTAAVDARRAIEERNVQLTQMTAAFRDEQRGKLVAQEQTAKLTGAFRSTAATHRALLPTDLDLDATSPDALAKHLADGGTRLQADLRVAQEEVATARTRLAAFDAITATTDPEKLQASTRKAQADLITAQERLAVEQARLTPPTTTELEQKTKDLQQAQVNSRWYRNATIASSAAWVIHMFGLDKLALRKTAQGALWILGRPVTPATGK